MERTDAIGENFRAAMAEISGKKREPCIQKLRRNFEFRRLILLKEGVFRSEAVEIVVFHG